MAQLVKEFTGLKYNTMDRWNGEDLSGSVVFSCVDSMKTRKQIIESMKTGLFIETRMGVKHGQVFTIDTSDDDAVQFWKDRWVGDDLVEEKSACGTSLTIGSTAQLLSAIATWQLIRHMNDQEKPRCLTACVDPYMIMET